MGTMQAVGHNNDSKYFVR